MREGAVDTTWSLVLNEQEYQGEDGAEGTLDLVSGDKVYRRSRRRTEYIQF